MSRDEGLFAAYSEVIERVGDARLRLYLYHFPQMTGLFLSIPLIERLSARYPDIVVGMKDSSGDLANMLAVAAALPGFAVFSGSDELLLPLLEGGGAGCITACCNVASPLAAAVHAAWRNGDRENAVAVQQTLSEVRRIISAYPLSAALKALLALTVAGRGLGARPPAARRPRCADARARWRTRWPPCLSSPPTGRAVRRLPKRRRHPYRPEPLPVTAPPTIEAGGRTVALVVRRRRAGETAHPSPRRRRRCGCPDAAAGARLADGLAFVAEERGADRRHCSTAGRRGCRSPTAPSSRSAARPHRIVAAARHRGVRVDGSDAPRRRNGKTASPATLGRWLRAQAQTEMTARSHETAARLGPGPRRPLGRVRVKEMRTRWGSCTPAGDLNYAWRLIMAPPFVLAYVAAHEVAHLAHPGHDRAFWSTCARLAAADPAPARAWLREEGRTLLRYG